MKKIIFILAAFFVLFNVAAQEKMNVQLKSSQTISYNVDDVEKVTFSEASSEEPVQPGNYGIHPTQIGNCHYTYDEKGRLTSMADEDGQYRLDYTTMTMSFDGMQVGTFELNADGYISKSEAFSGYGNSTETFTYEDGHVVEYTLFYKDEEETERAVQKFIWENGNLVKIIDDSYFTSNKYNDSEYHDVLFVTYSSQDNPSGQVTKGMLGQGNYDEFIMHQTGMLGAGSKKLPVSAYWTYDGDPSSPDTYSYTLNANGTVAVETINGEPVAYRYDSDNKAPKKKGRKHGLFSPLSRKSKL